MSLINSVLKAFEKGDNFRDYQHASRTFVANNYELQPRYSNLFHVVFNFTPEAARMFDNVTKLEMPMLVKSIGLPTYTINTETHNQYNRQVHSQHKIVYAPVQIIFHDDQKDLIRTLWYRYMSYYYKDSMYEQGGGDYSTDDRYTKRKREDWGYDVGKGRFFSDIRVYSMFQKRFAEYILINPIIESFSHGQHAYDNSGLMEHTMGIAYETVKYSTGIVNNINPKGFGDLHYDTTPSPIGIFGRGAQNSIFFGGGLLEGINSVTDDLASGNLLGAVIKGGIIFNNTRNTNLKDVLFKDAQRAVGKVLRGENPLTGVVVPKVFNAASPNLVSSQKFIGAPGKGVGDPGTVNSNRATVFNPTFYDVDDDVDIPLGNASTILAGTASAAVPRKLSDNNQLERIGDIATSQAQIQKGIINRTKELSAQIQNNPNDQKLINERAALLERYRLESGKAYQENDF